MKFTLNDCISRINQVLNYPAVAYEDVSHFFDQAIFELNTNLHIAIPSVSEMRAEHTFEVTEQPGLVRLVARPTSSDTIPYYTSVDSLPSDPASQYAYVCSTDFSNRKFYKHLGGTVGWVNVPSLYGIYLDANGSMDTYSAIAISTSVAVWTTVDRTHLTAFDLTDYMPMSWWVLFVIPYVCFKFAVRNGDSGELFADEFTQGYQQLQASYNVPNTVKLFEVAEKPAYADLVSENLHNLGTSVFTRAIYESMRVGNGISSTYSTLNGGWGL